MREIEKAVRVMVLLGLAVLIFEPACTTTPSQGPRADREIWQRIDQPSIVVCGGCHQEVYGEWAGSLHHGAWTNRNVRTATDDFEKAVCRSCHSPKPVLLTGLDRRPDYRDFNQEDGVHCLSCHALEDGVAAARTIEGAPCRPRYEPRLLRVDLCYPCHEPTHQAFTEYGLSDAKATGVRCVDCHMQPTEHRRGRSHGSNGGFNAEFVKRALGWRCWIADGHVHVELRNRCGHKFPGEIPSRSFLVRVEFEGSPAAVQELLRKPFKGEDRPDNRLRPDEVRVIRVPLPEGVEHASVQLLFKPLPLMPVEQSFSLGRWSSRQDR